MKGLWKYLVPFSPDTSGFASAITGTDGIGLFDDIRGCAGNYMITEEVRPVHPPKVAVSEIADEDVITGTAPKVMQRFYEMREDLEADPSFVMLCSCPVSSLIGTDLEAIAAQISDETGIPASSVDFSGYEHYDTGMKKTLTAMAKLLCQKPAAKRKTINILGANFMDWAAEDAEEIRDFCADNGLIVQSVWGANGSAAEFRSAAEASLNWVVSAVGMDLAKWMKKEYGIPYICGAPFGSASADLLLPAAASGKQPEFRQSEGDPEVLILGEQFAANALRESLLRDYGFRSVQTAGFFTMEKSLRQPGDRKLKEENDLLDLLRTTPAEIIIGDPMMDLVKDSGKQWISLPHLPVSTRMYGKERPGLLGWRTEYWIRENLRGTKE